MFSEVFFAKLLELKSIHMAYSLDEDVEDVGDGIFWYFSVTSTQPHQPYLEQDVLSLCHQSFTYCVLD